MALAILALIGLPFIAAAYLLAGLWAGGEWIVKKLVTARRRRIARAEAELDRQQEQMRSTIWQLANELSGGAHEARKALIRASFDASQQDANRPGT